MDPHLRSCLAHTLPSRFEKQVPLATPEEFRSWIIHEDSHYLVLDKPPWIVCHPSKQGPYSSLVGAIREHTQESAAYIIGRLDRETSGVLLSAKVGDTIHRTKITQKVYVTILKGEIDVSKGELEVKLPLRRHVEARSRVEVCPLDHEHGAFVNENEDEEDDDESGPFATLVPPPPAQVSASGVAGAVGEVAREVFRGGLTPWRDAPFTGPCKKAHTRFVPLLSRNGFTLCRVFPKTGRLHQIRLHSLAVSEGIAGDKMYGCDFGLFVEFADAGMTDRIWNELEMPRHSLHCESITFESKLPRVVSGGELAEAHRERQRALYYLKVAERRQRDVDSGRISGPVTKESLPPPPDSIYKPLVVKEKVQHTYTSQLSLDMILYSHLKMGVSIEELHSLGLVKDVGATTDTVQAIFDKYRR